MEEADFDLEGLPYSADAEAAVLGTLLLESELIVQAFEFVSEESFYSDENRKLFNVLSDLFLEGMKIDFITVLNAVVSQHVFETEGHAKIYLNQIMDIVPSISNFRNYCKIVKEKHILRKLIIAAKKIEKLAIRADSDVENILDSAEQELFEIRQGKHNKRLISIENAIVKELDFLDEVVSGVKKVAMSFGYSSLDSILTGLRPSDLIVLAARPAMGKTSFALNITTRVAKQSGKSVVIFSLEMSVQQLVERMLSSECSILTNKIHSGNISFSDGNNEWESLAAGAQELSKCKIFFDDSPNPTVAEIKAKLRRFSDLGLVVIDYLQLMTSGKRRDGNRVQEISEITRMLKILAKDLEVAVIVISQLARGPELRQDHRPVLSDLRESGSIEQDADVVLFLYRDEYYNPQEAKPGIAECIVAKNRHGETGSFELNWEGKYTRFVGLDKFHEID